MYLVNIIVKPTPVNIFVKPTNSPTQDQPDPRKNRLKVAFSTTFFPQQIIFRGLGLVLYRKQTTRNLTNQILGKHPVVLLYITVVDHPPTIVAVTVDVLY